MEANELKLKLNNHLKLHPEYEDWMEFDDVEVKADGVVVPRYKSPKPYNSNMSKLKARQIYGQVCSDILP